MYGSPAFSWGDLYVIHGKWHIKLVNIDMEYGKPVFQTMALDPWFWGALLGVSTLLDGCGLRKYSPRLLRRDFA